HQREDRAGDLEVVELLRVQCRDRPRLPGLLQVLGHGAGGVGGVVPSLERGDRHRSTQYGKAVELGHVISLRRVRRAVVATGPRRFPPGRLRAGVKLGQMPTSTPVSTTVRFLDLLADRVLLADGAMGTMLQQANPSLDDFEGYEGCNEILNVTRPDVVRGIHDAYLAAGADCVETNTFGANFGNLGEYGIVERVRELSHAGAALAREVADGWSTPDRPRFVIGSVGPG